MNIITLYNSHKYPYHTQITKALETIVSSNGSNAHFIDIKNTNSSQFTQQLSSNTPDLIITLDLAGFEFRTLAGECLLNMLACKVCNILWGAKPEYKDYLSGKLSLSMLFYDATGNDNQLPAKYTNMRYYYPTSKIISLTELNNTETESELIETLQNIWDHFIAEILR